MTKKEEREGKAGALGASQMTKGKEKRVETVDKRNKRNGMLKQVMRGERRNNVAESIEQELRIRRHKRMKGKSCKN